MKPLEQRLFIWKSSTFIVRNPRTSLGLISPGNLRPPATRCFQPKPYTISTQSLHRTFCHRPKCPGLKVESIRETNSHAASTLLEVHPSSAFLTKSTTPRGVYDQPRHRRSRPKAGRDCKGSDFRARSTQDIQKDPSTACKTTSIDWNSQVDTGAMHTHSSSPTKGECGSPSFQLRNASRCLAIPSGSQSDSTLTVTS